MSNFIKINLSFDLFRGFLALMLFVARMASVRRSKRHGSQQDATAQINEEAATVQPRSQASRAKRSRVAAPREVPKEVPIAKLVQQEVAKALAKMNKQKDNPGLVDEADGPPTLHPIHDSSHSTVPQPPSVARQSEVNVSMPSESGQLSPPHSHVNEYVFELPVSFFTENDAVSVVEY